MSEEDYESLPANSTVSTHMMAGAAAGIMEHIVIYPVDSVKTRMQCLVPDPRANYRNVADALYRIAVHEGLRNTLRGVNAVIYGAGPAHAMYFACYEKLKKTLSRTDHSNHLAHAAAGAGATLLHDAVMNPADVVKQRMQMYNSPFKTCWECMVKTYHSEGMRAFYRSYTTQLSMNIPFQCMHFMVYELCQDKLNQERQYNPKTHMISGALAGGFAAAITTPLDVCKTLLNTQEKCATSKGGAIQGFADAVRTVYKFRGVGGYFQGLSARVIYVMPGTAISWSVYEFFKWWISSKNSARCDGLVSGAAVQVHAVGNTIEER